MRRRAFSLVELLVVVAMVALLSVLVLPSITSVTRGTALTRGGQIVSDQFALARQEAMAKNREVQVRFLWKDGAPAGWRGVQLWAATPTDVTDYRPISRVAWLPEGTLVSGVATMSPLIGRPTIPDTNGEIPGRGLTRYCGFRFRAGGGSDLGFNTSSNFVTVVRDQDASATVAPANYVVVQVDSVNGRVRSYRP